MDIYIWIKIKNPKLIKRKIIRLSLFIETLIMIFFDNSDAIAVSSKRVKSKVYKYDYWSFSLSK